MILSPHSSWFVVSSYTQLVVVLLLPVLLLLPLLVCWSLASWLGHYSQQQEIFQHKMTSEVMGDDVVNRAFAPAAASGFTCAPGSRQPNRNPSR